MFSFMFLTFSKWWVIECTSSQSASKETFFQANRNYCLFSSSSVFSWCWIFLWCLVNVTPDGLLRVYITWVCQPSTLGFQVCKSFCDRVCMSLFVFKVFQPLLVIHLHTVVLETLILLKVEFFFTFLSCRIFTHSAYTYSFFDNICHIFAK